MGRSPKASHIALLWPKSSHIALLEGKMGRFRPILPFWKGNMGRPSRTRKEGGGEALFVSGRAVWPHFAGGGEVVLDDSLLDLSRVDLDFFAGFAGKRGCGLRLFRSDFRLVQANGVVNLDFFTVNLSLRLVSCGLRIFCLIAGKRGCELRLFHSELVS